MFASYSFVFLLSAAVVIADKHQARNPHAAIAKRLNSTSLLDKRATYNDIEMTWYPTDTGPDACTGKNHKDSDFFVAMGYDQFGNGGCCGKKLRINYNGKSAVAQCVDECATCPQYGQLDLTKGLFQYFTEGDLGIGVIHASWEYVDGDDDDGGDDSTTTKKTTAHPTTSTHHTTSTTTKEFVEASTHTLSSKKHSSSAKPTSSAAKSSSSVKHSASSKPSSSEPASSTGESSSLPSPTEGVANVGSSAGTPAEPGDSGPDNISGALTGSNGAASLGSNKFVVAVAALILVAFQAL